MARMDSGRTRTARLRAAAAQSQKTAHHQKGGHLNLGPLGQGGDAQGKAHGTTQPYAPTADGPSGGDITVYGATVDGDGVITKVHHEQLLCPRQGWGQTLQAERLAEAGGQKPYTSVKADGRMRCMRVGQSNH